MPFLSAELNAQANDAAGRAATVHLHTGDPGTSGLANEVSGGGYAPVAPGFSSGGAVGPLGSGSQPATVGVAWGAPAFTVPATTITFWSLRNSGGTCLGYWSVTSTPVPAGTYTPNIAIGPGV